MDDNVKSKKKGKSIKSSSSSPSKTSSRTSSRASVSSLDKAPCHTFGDRRYLYWESCKGHGLYIRAKWKDLKDEMLNNSICNLSLPQWQCLWTKAQHLHSTKRGRRSVAFKYWKMGSGVQIHATRFGIKEKSRMSTVHIVAAMIYCNFHDLSQRFSSTFTGTSSLDEFAILARFLVEVVTVFGAPLNGSKRSLYHEIEGESQLFTHLSCRYIAPQSFSSLFDVVWGYADPQKEGLILKMSQYENGSNPFTMNTIWFSDFAMEYEYIGIYSEEPMRIDTIIHIKECCNFRDYIHSMDILSTLLVATLPNYEVTPRTMKALSRLITLKMEDDINIELELLDSNGTMEVDSSDDDDGVTVSVPEYVERLFESKCLEVRSLEMDCRQIFDAKLSEKDRNNGCYALLRPLFIVEKDSWIKIDLLAALFPNLSSITMRWCYGYFVVNSNTFGRLIEVLKSEQIRNRKSFRIEFAEQVVSGEYMDSVVKKQMKAFKKLGFELLTINESVIVRKVKKSKGRLSLTRSKTEMIDKDEHRVMTPNSPSVDEKNDDADCLVM